MVTVCPSQFATRRTLFHVLVGCGLLMLKVDRKSGSAGMPRPISYAVFCLKKKIADIPSQLTFHDAPEQPIAIGSLTVSAALVTHQGPTVGYRIEENGRVAVYLPDHEPGIGQDLAEQPADWISGHGLAHGADILLHDAQYGDEEYTRHIGWGHSAIGHVVAFARKAEVQRLVLFHHAP